MTKHYGSAFTRRDFVRSTSCAVLWGGASLGSASAEPYTVVPARVVVNRSVSAGKVSAKLIGLSFEKSKLSTKMFATSNRTLVGCFKRLGAGMLRLGGNAVDSTTWRPNGSGGKDGEVAPADVRALADFLQRTGWQVMYGLNLGSNTPAGAAAEAKYAAGALGSSLAGFEIGNECDLYSGNGIRPKTYTVSDFITEWSTYAGAIRQVAPTALLTGPGSAGYLETWTIPFATSESSRIGQLTQHYYRDGPKKPTSTMSLLLQDHKHLPRVLKLLESTVSANGISGGYRLAEVNTFSSGGAPDVSDAHGAALWAIDVLLTSSQHSCMGINFHGGSNRNWNPPYTPISDNASGVVELRPLYYGMLFVAQIAPGPMYGVSVSAALNLSAYAVSGNDGATYVAVVNKEPDTSGAVSIDLGGPDSRISGLVLAAPGLDSVKGTTLGRVAVGSAGEWSPIRETYTTVVGGALAVTVGPASALLLRVS